MNRTLRDTLCHAQAVVDNLMVEQNQEAVIRDLEHQLADYVAHAKCIKERGDYSTTFRLSVYVLSPDELYSLVQDEARRLLLYMPGR